MVLWSLMLMKLANVAKHSAYPKRQVEVYVFFLSYSGFGLRVFSWFLLPLNTSGQIVDAQKPAWRWRLEQL